MQGSTHTVMREVCMSNCYTVCDLYTLLVGSRLLLGLLLYLLSIAIIIFIVCCAYL